MSAMFTSAIYQLFLWILSSLTLDWILWDDYTHLDLSQCTLNKTVLHVAATYLKSETACTLNKTVLHVAATYLKSETATCLRFFLSLVSKHLKMTLTPTGESEEEEHASLFFQLVLKLLDFSVACFSTVSRSPLLEDDMLRDTLENYILEELNLVKELITEIKWYGKKHNFSESEIDEIRKEWIKYLLHLIF